jgi:hypothetical protein
MGWRFRRSVKILPSVRLNFGKKGFTSATIGGKFVKTNVSKRGTFNTYSLPGTGLSYRTKVSGGKTNQPSRGAIFKNQPSWRCRCGMINLPENENCESCKVLNPVIRRQREGLDWYCKTCYYANTASSRFCGKCGDQFNPNPQQPERLGSQDGKHVAILFGGIAGLVVFLAILGAIFQNSTQNPVPSQIYQPPITDSKSFTASNNEPTINVPAQTKSNTKTLAQNKSATAKNAIVISENANLRKTPNQNGEVAQTIAEGTNVEVFKQRGAWFYVHSNGNTGWLHGNTIRLTGKEKTVESLASEDSTTDSYSVPTYNYPSSSSYSSSRYSTYAPKTVHVSGYFRSNGTYVHSCVAHLIVNIN